MLHGFANPVFDGQGAFRRVMEAMANPGEMRRVTALPGNSGTDTQAAKAPAALPPAALATVLAMCDFETRVYLSPALRRVPAIADAVRFHTGAELTDNPATAAFAITDPVADRLCLAEFAQGTPEYPDRSTTVIVLCRSFETGPDLTVSGPGVPATRRIAPAGLPTDFAAQMIANRAGFPLGVDVLLVVDDRMIGLPRSVHLTLGDM